MVIQHSGIPDNIHGMGGFNILATTLHQAAFGTAERCWVLPFFFFSFFFSVGELSWDIYINLQVEYKQLPEPNQTNSSFLRDSVNNRH